MFKPTPNAYRILIYWPYKVFFRIQLKKFNKFEEVQKYIKDWRALSINAIIVYIIMIKNEIEKERLGC